MMTWTTQLEKWLAFNQLDSELREQLLVIEGNNKEFL